MTIYIVSTLGCDVKSELSPFSHLFTTVDSVDQAMELYKAKDLGKVPMVTYAYDVDQVKDLVLRLQNMPDLSIIVLMGESSEPKRQSQANMSQLTFNQSFKVN